MKSRPDSALTESLTALIPLANLSKTPLTSPPVEKQEGFSFDKVRFYTFKILILQVLLKSFFLNVLQLCKKFNMYFFGSELCRI